MYNNNNKRNDIFVRSNEIFLYKQIIYVMKWIKTNPKFNIHV
jgi:biopolymer transport protein ExbD